MPKGSQRKGFVEKNTTEESLENRKLNAARDAFGNPQQNTTETLFTVEDVPKAKVSRRGATAHTPLESSVRVYREDAASGLPTLSDPACLSRSVF